VGIPGSRYKTKHDHVAFSKLSSLVHEIVERPPVSTTQQAAA
jgi:hypothetical protein